MAGAPELKQFRTERSLSGVLHLVFDMPGRSMNVFSNAAIEELGRFADWLPQSDVAGVVICSGKSSAFCAGADLASWDAYDISWRPRAERGPRRVRSFFRLSHGLRKLELRASRRGSDRGIGVGGGAEFALARITGSSPTQPQSTFGLPESLVGYCREGGTSTSSRLIASRRPCGAARWCQDRRGGGRQPSVSRTNW